MIEIIKHFLGRVTSRLAHHTLLEEAARYLLNKLYAKYIVGPDPLDFHKFMFFCLQYFSQRLKFI